MSVVMVESHDPIGDQPDATRLEFRLRSGWQGLAVAEHRQVVAPVAIERPRKCDRLRLHHATELPAREFRAVAIGAMEIADAPALGCTGDVRYVVAHTV